MPDTKLVTWEGLLCHYGRFPCKNSGNLRLMVISSDFLLSFFPILLSCLPKANIYQIAASSKNGTNQKHPFTNIPKQVHQNILTSCNTSDAFETHRNATKTNWLHAPFPTPQKKTAAAPKQIPGTSWNILQPHEIWCGCFVHFSWFVKKSWDSWASILPNDSIFNRIEGFTHAQTLESDVEHIPRKVTNTQVMLRWSETSKHAKSLISVVGV